MSFDEAVSRAIGAELREARQAAGWSHSQLVRRMATPIPVNTYSCYETGRRGTSIPVLITVCEALGETVPELIDRALERVARPTAEPKNDEYFLSVAIKLATQSPESIGCATVLVSAARVVLAEAYNSTRLDEITVHHAEIKAINIANAVVQSHILPQTTAYCSCEPCAMCLTALSLANVHRIVYRWTLAQTFPDDPQSQFDSAAFVAGLNFVPQLEQLIPGGKS